MAQLEIVLASSSPRRAALLRALGIDLTIVAPHVDESARAGEEPVAYAARLAAEKAATVAAGLVSPERTAVVLGADTVVVAGALMGKPDDANDARGMLRRLAGRTHEVFTAVHLVRGDGSAAATIERTVVRFRAYDDRWVDWYVGTGEPFGKAGAYSIQGAGALLCERIEGSWSNVVGLPVEALPGLFARVGVDFLANLDRGAPGAHVHLGVLSCDDDGRKA